MSVTIKQIAELSGYSRGTVDRVVNKRGNVKKDTKKHIENIAKQLNYEPNLAAKALAARKKFLVIGVVAASVGNPFFEEVFEGIEAETVKLREYGVNTVTRTMRGYDAEEQLQLICEIEDEISALVLHPINDARIAKKINELHKKGIVTIAFNTDIEGSSRLCYVGSDYISGGAVACGMLSFITSGAANIGVLLGTDKILGHRQRLEGFKGLMEKKFPNFNLIATGETYDDDIQGYETTKNMLEQHPEIDALFVASAGTYGIFRAVTKLGLEKKLSIVTFDATDVNKDAMKKGIIESVICQEAFLQGSTSMRVASDYLISGALPEAEEIIMKNEIKILENL